MKEGLRLSRPTDIALFFCSLDAPLIMNID